MGNESEINKTRNRRILKKLKEKGLPEFLKSLEQESEGKVIDTKILVLELRFPIIGGDTNQIKVWINLHDTYSSTIIYKNQEEFVIGSEACPTIQDAILKAIDYIKGKKHNNT